MYRLRRQNVRANNARKAGESAVPVMVCISKYESSFKCYK